jgi:hypothetical protein
MSTTTAEQAASSASGGCPRCTEIETEEKEEKKQQQAIHTDTRRALGLKPFQKRTQEGYKNARKNELVASCDRILRSMFRVHLRKGWQAQANQGEELPAPTIDSYLIKHKQLRVLSK